MDKKFRYLRALRVQYGYTQEQMANILGVHVGTYNRKEQGLSQFSVIEAKTISDLFNNTIEDIFFNEGVHAKGTNAARIYSVKEENSEVY